MPDLKVELRGRDYDVTVGSDGEFRATGANGSEVKAETLKSLKDKLAKAAVRVSVPYTRYEQERFGGDLRFVDGEFTGRHSDGRRLLARENGTAVQYQTYHLRGLMVRLNDEQRAELTRLHEAQQHAKARLDEFVATYRMTDPHSSIERAIDAAGQGDDDGHRDR